MPASLSASLQVKPDGLFPWSSAPSGNSAWPEYTAESVDSISIKKGRTFRGAVLSALP